MKESSDIAPIPVNCPRCGTRAWKIIDQRGAWCGKCQLWTVGNREERLEVRIEELQDEVARLRSQMWVHPKERNSCLETENFIRDHISAVGRESGDDKKEGGKALGTLRPSAAAKPAARMAIIGKWPHDHDDPPSLVPSDPLDPFPRGPTEPENAPVGYPKSHVETWCDKHKRFEREPDMETP